ncbi:MAG: DUF1549 domain-containing protein, partial [Planctomycetes bacterium]|nr:DUF1549 domain-containing protein [Planctomycetota bacterium]
MWRAPGPLVTRCAVVAGLACGALRAQDEPGEAHWSFRPLSRPAVPASGAAHPVDAFLDAARATAGIAAAPPADSRSFARRAYLDVIGLPPTPEEVAAYVAEAARDEVAARAALIERLLASPRHGERWARHWLDVVRFAESDGFETNQPRPNAWPYRDYVIRAFNEDLPFERFVREQLAGDQLGADEATGFLVGGPWDRVKSPDPVLTANQRADELHDMVATTGSAFLGLTVGCARCHDHKFDPITQRDYTALVAVFAGVQHGERPFAKLREERAAELAALEPELAELERALEEAEPLADPASNSPRRAAVSSKRNTERFAPRLATALRFEIDRTNNGSEPCLDELELQDAQGVNHARTARVASSGDYAGDPQHRLEHLCDGIVGNAKSWISNTPGRGWVELELAAPAVVECLVWGRDREARFADRTAIDYRISLRDDAGTWSEVASSRDRASADAPLTGPLEELARAHRELQARVTALRAVPQVYAGRFEAPPPTQLCHRGDPMQPRERVAPG